MKQVSPQLYKSYLAIIKNSVGTNAYRNLIVTVDGEEQDITKDGILSCAYFVSSVLHMFQLINSPHATVTGTIRAMEQTGWEKIEKPLEGAVLVWEEKFAYGSANKHIGFFVSSNKAISNDPRTRVPKLHHWTFGEKNGKPARTVEAIFWHEKLTKNQRQ